MKTAVSILAFFLITGLSTHPVSAVAQEAPAVTVVAASIKDARESIALTGRVVSVQKVDIRARVSGFVETVNFKEGEKVSAGDVLYEIEDDAYRAAVNETVGSIGASEAALRLAEIERDRQRTLVEKQAAPQSQLDVAEANVDKTSSQLVTLKASKDRADLQLSYTKITAPFDGVTGLTTVDIGGLVGPESSPLTTLTRLDPISVEFPASTALYLEYRQRVRSGEISGKADVTLTQANGAVYPLKGDIDFVSSNVNQGTDTIIVRAEFKNPDSILLDGELVNVELAQSTPEPVLTVPQQSVLRDQAGSYVMVVGADSKVEARRVRIARTSGQDAVVADGIKEGERVVTEGFAKIRPGIVVDALQ